MRGEKQLEEEEKRREGMEEPEDAPSRYSNCLCGIVFLNMSSGLGLCACDCVCAYVCVSE